MINFLLDIGKDILIVIGIYFFIYGFFFMASWGWRDGRGKQITDVYIK